VTFGGEERDEAGTDEAGRSGEGDMKWKCHGWILNPRSACRRAGTRAEGPLQFVQNVQ
jgi:hypothetical protein